MLTESVKTYRAMINPVLDALMGSGREVTGPEINLVERTRQLIRDKWERETQAVTKVFRDTNKITWYLRMSRLNIAKYQKGIDPVKLQKMIQEYDRKLSLYRTVTSFATDDFSITSLDVLEHYMSLPIKEIHDFQFGNKSFREVIDAFKSFEDEWKKSQESSIEDDSGKVIIDFGNGWVWVNTEKAYCDKEAQAMGHCGNSPRQYSDDLLLSLRKKVMGRDGKTRWEPHLTFILDGSKQLTEMKGKGNEKPVARYHDMIIALLLNPIVKGITGGGYLPENNFSLDDLPEDKKEELIEKKPELGSILDYYEKYGDDRVFRKKLYDILYQHGYEYHDIHGSDVILQEKTLDTFFREDQSSLEELWNVTHDDYSDIEWLDHTTFLDTIKVLVDEDSEEINDLEKLIADKLHVSREEAFDSLDYVFPKSTTRLLTEIKKRARGACAYQIEEFFKDIYPLYRNARFDIDMKTKNIRIYVDLVQFIEDVSEIGSEYDELNEIFNHHDGDWFHLGYHDEDYIAKGVQDISHELTAEFCAMIAGLLDVDDQLEFDFNK